MLKNPPLPVRKISLNKKLCGRSTWTWYQPCPSPEVEFCLRESYSFRAGLGINPVQVQKWSLPKGKLQFSSWTWYMRGLAQPSIKSQRTAEGLAPTRFVILGYLPFPAFSLISSTFNGMPPVIAEVEPVGKDVPFREVQIVNGCLRDIHRQGQSP